MGEFFIQVISCKGRIAEANPATPGEHFGRWATLADMLLQGQDLLGGIAPGEHAVKVQLAYDKEDGEAPVSVASVYLLCECDIEIIQGQRVQSALVTPSHPQQKSKIATPSLIVPR